MAFIGNTPTTQAFTPAVDYFSGNASTTAFTLSRPVASVAQVQVVVNNVAQNPSSAYTVSSNTITFTSAPSAGTNNIYVYYTSPITQVIAPGQGTVTATSMASSTGTGAGVFQTSPTITTPTIDTITSAASTALTLKSAGTTALTIDTSQNVGIGTTPYTKLQVTGTIKVATGNAQGILSLGDGAGSAVNCGIYRGAAVGPTTDGNFLNIGGYDGIVFTTGNSVVASQTERMRIDQNGNVLVNYTSLPSPFYGTILVRNVGATAGKYWQTGPYTNNNYQLYNNSNVGQYMVDGATSWTTSSDARLKNITGTYANALSDIAQIQPVKFTWKADESNTPQVGVIAQSVENIVPEAISRTQCIPDDETEYLGVRYTELIPLMIASIQELKAMVDSIQSEFDAYKATHP